MTQNARHSGPQDPARRQPGSDGPAPLPALPHHGDSPPPTTAHFRGHGLMMIVCCIPMLVLAGLLVVTGVAGASAIVFAVACTAMMAAMMFGMQGGHRR